MVHGDNQILEFKDVLSRHLAPKSFNTVVVIYTPQRFVPVSVVIQLLNEVADARIYIKFSSYTWFMPTSLSLAHLDMKCVLP